MLWLLLQCKVVPNDKKSGTKESLSITNNNKGGGVFTGGNIIVKNQFRSPAAASAQGFITATTTTINSTTTTNTSSSSSSSEKESYSPNSRVKHQHNTNTTHPLSPFTSASKHDQVAMLLGLLAKNNITMEQLLSMSEDEQKSLLISIVDANNRGDVTFDSCKGHLDLATALKGILDKNNKAKRAKEVTNLSASAIAVKTAKYDMEHQIHNSYSSSSSVVGNANDGNDEDSNSMGNARRNMLEVIKRRSQQQQQQQQASSTTSSGSSYDIISNREDNDEVTINDNIGGTHYYTVGDHQQRASSFTSNTSATAVDYTTPSKILISQSEFAKYFKMVKVGDIISCVMR